MNPAPFLPGFARFPDTLTSVVSDLSGEQILWRPKPSSWSLLEVVNHLLDEEREDFRVRIDYTLNRPDEPWPAIDPEGWVVQRDYQSRDLNESLEQFRTQRLESVAWLKGLTNPDWEAAYEHPRAGPIKTGELFASWMAHDNLHLAQIARLKVAYTKHLADPYSTSYAG